ncbi:MAG: hypothetical protein ABIH10_00255 [Spirochaetota bacterium]
MAYKCPQCGYAAEQEGACPTCNVPMNEVKEEVASAEAAPSEAQEPEKAE